MKTAIEIKNLSVIFNDENTLTNIDLNIGKGEFVYIIGPNGGGKTTLIRSLLGLNIPTSGQISIFGEKIKKAKTLIGYVPQKSETDKSFPITVKETVETALLHKGLNPFKSFKKETDFVLNLLKELNIEHLANHQIGTLSGGEFQRVLIARALARNPQILILDEPCANTDTASSHKIHEILEKQNQKGVTIIVVSHDINHVLDSKTRTVFINKKILFDGIADDTILKLG